MISDFEKKLFEEMRKCWDAIDEAHTDIPRGFFKHGFISGGRFGYQQGIKDAIEALRSEEAARKFSQIKQWPTGSKKGLV